jgi:hypothetical protein
MKILGLSIIIVLSMSNSWAFDYGTFSVEIQESSQKRMLEPEIDTFRFDSVPQRSPAAIEDSSIKVHVTEISGTFQD